MIPLWAVVAIAIMAGGAVANEMGHGLVAEGLGLGHHHIFDHGGYHCATPGDEAWERHVEHQHHGGDHCGRRHMGYEHGGMRAP